MAFPITGRSQLLGVHKAWGRARPWPGLGQAQPSLFWGDGKSWIFGFFGGFLAVFGQKTKKPWLITMVI